MKVSSLIYDTLEKDNNHWAPKAHYPSSASFKFSSGKLIGPDTLTSYLKWTGVKASNVSDGPGLLRMRLGDGTHNELAKILAKSGIKVLSEVGAKVKIDGLENLVSYRVDHLLEVEKIIEVLEVKSSQERQMFNPAYGIIRKGPKPDHLLQVICYLNLVPGVSRARLLYIDRSTGGMIEFVITKDGDKYFVDDKAVPELSWLGIVDRWKVLEAALKVKEEPKPEHLAWINDKTGEVMPKKSVNKEEFKTPWRVMYNDYRDHIWKDPKHREHSLNAILEREGIEAVRKLCED